MKNAMISLILFVASVSANATSLHPDTFAQVATMKIIKMDKAYNQEVVGAELKINLVSKIARLTLKMKQPCGRARPGQMTCLAIAPDQIVELPIVGASKNGCGSTVIVAKRNMMPVDGAAETLTIVDHRTATCKTAIAFLGMTEVRLNEQFYNRMTGQLVNKDSYLAGEALRSPFIR